MTHNAKQIRVLQEKLANPPEAPEDMDIVKRESQPTLDALRQIAIQATDVKHQLYDLDQEKKRTEDVLNRTKQRYGFYS